MILTLGTPAAVTGGNDRQPANEKDVGESADSGLFGDILGTQKSLPPVDAAPSAEHLQFAAGGKELPGDGKELPSTQSPAPAALEFTHLVPKGLSVSTASEVVVLAEASAPAPVKPGPHLPIDPPPQMFAEPDAVLPAGQDMLLFAGQGTLSPAEPGVQPVTSPDAPQPIGPRSAGSQGPLMTGDMDNASVPDLVPVMTAGDGSLLSAGVLRQGSGEPPELAESPPRTDLTAIRAGAGSGSVGAAAPTASAAVAGVLNDSAFDALAGDGVKADRLVEPGDVIRVPEQTQSKPQALVQAATATGTIHLPTPQADAPANLRSDFPATMTTFPGQPGWSAEIAGRINFLVKGGKSEASIQLSPAELGRLEIRISTDDDQARILFTVQNATAREAIEQAMPRLRDMLEQSGLQLAQSTVSDQSQSGSQQRQRGVLDTPAGALADLEQNPEEFNRERLLMASDAAVDYYV